MIFRYRTATISSCRITLLRLITTTATAMNGPIGTLKPNRLRIYHKRDLLIEMFIRFINGD